MYVVGGAETPYSSLTTVLQCSTPSSIKHRDWSGARPLKYANKCATPRSAVGVDIFWSTPHPPDTAPLHTMPPARKKAIVYRVTGIPVGDKAQSALQGLLDDEDTDSNVRSKLEQALNGPPEFAQLSKDDQAIAFLKVAVTTELSQNPGIDAQRFRLKLIPSVYDPHRYRSALLWFTKETPSFLKGLETKHRMERFIVVDSVILIISRGFYEFTQLYEPTAPVVAEYDSPF